MFKALAFMIAGGAAFSADLFPLRTGNTWTYRDATTGASFTVRVGTPLVSNDRVYYSVSGYLPTPVLVRLDDKGNMVYLDLGAEQEHVLTSFTRSDEGQWDAPLRECPRQQGTTLSKPSAIDGPAGRFENALEIHYQVLGCADVGVQSELYAENIGMVQRTVGTIAGPRTYDLVYARVGETEIEAGPVGKFSVSVSQSGPMTITLRLRTDPVDSLLLHFNSGQEYEATIEDATGNTVWRWSDGMSFIQALHDKSVTGEWTVVIPVGTTQPARAAAQPRRHAASTAAPQALVPGNYKVHAWLTTAGPVPAYSATGVFTVK